MATEDSRRLSADDRREQILAAASVVFGERGYAGGTTDAIAREAGISQAYVVRMFGSKERLFRATAERAAIKVREAFIRELDALGDGASREDTQRALGGAYAGLMADRGLLLSLLHLFSQGHDETLAPVARGCFLDIYRLVRERGGMSGEQATAFFAQGMLMTVLFAMRMPDAAGDADAQELMACAFGEKRDELIQLGLLHEPLDRAPRS
ncbi:MAG: TetR/AcrR family transcriptional regulator [Demequina sp.]|uniref:TetR/AcrR family transcriptional regulator n=1 Tax=Demequina sp. TaxID=2050685 RepID=UPI003A8ADF81